MKQPQPQVVRDSKDMTMSAVINRGGGRPSKGLRKYIGFRTPAKTAEDVQMIAAAKGMTVTDYVSSAVDRSLREDLALLDHFALQEELPIRIAPKQKKARTRRAFEAEDPRSGKLAGEQIVDRMEDLHRPSFVLQNRSWKIGP
jgi:hypothetical protein